MIDQMNIWFEKVTKPEAEVIYFSYMLTFHYQNFYPEVFRMKKRFLMFVQSLMGRGKKDPSWGGVRIQKNLKCKCKYEKYDNQAYMMN